MPIPAIAITATARDQPAAVVSGAKLKAAARVGAPRVDRPMAMAPNARTLPMTRARRAGSGNAEPMRPQSGTSHAA